MDNDEIIYRDLVGETRCKHIYRPKCGCRRKPQQKKHIPVEQVSLPPMLLVDDCGCSWTLSIITIDGINYWAVNGTILVDRNWNPITIEKLSIENNSSD